MSDVTYGPRARARTVFLSRLEELSFRRAVELANGNPEGSFERLEADFRRVALGLPPVGLDEDLTALAHDAARPPIEVTPPPVLEVTPAEPVVAAAVVCEDCGVAVDVENVRVLDLMRVDPGAPAGKSARAGGRRFRKVTLCRRCAGEALRQRSIRSATVVEGGVKRNLHRRERLAPKRGGRPRLLTDDHVRAAHTVYMEHGLSMREIAEHLHARGAKGTIGGLQSGLYLGFQRLGLPHRTKGEALEHAHRRGRHPGPLGPRSVA